MSNHNQIDDKDTAVLDGDPRDELDKNPGYIQENDRLYGPCDSIVDYLVGRLEKIDKKMEVLNDLSREYNVRIVEKTKQLSSYWIRIHDLISEPSDDQEFICEMLSIFEGFSLEKRLFPI